ncbi:DUF4290 domain-containing protein [Spirosoma radiotolerans]|uniref:Methionyl-tRNA formyltransferase n=1 Tax=Spirosoma radiotolerans TaxID=1379870 RepID=A0A0E3V5Z4_9BACT|nr:DUF4290 domain-containing protein [Spirosoma radiotolerans]AKD54081.1 hypothetical protein SD10_03365 [Spirosoma radiotolerans]
MKEYGSSIQKLVDNMVNIDDRSTRTRYAHILIELMRQIHPNMKDGQDYYNKLWDDLYIMSNFTLDVDSPYPPPSEEALGKKPQRVPYNTHHLKFKHFGRNVDLLIAKAVSLEEPEERRAFVSYLTRLMRTFYQAWNKESVEDETIYQSLIELSNGKLYDDIKLIREEGLVEATPRERTGDQPQRIVNNNYRNDRNREGGIGQQGRRNDRDNGARNNNNRNDRNRDGGNGQQGRSNNRNDGSQRNFGNRNRNDRDGGPRDGGPRDGGPRDNGSRNDGPPRRRR